ncbi:Dynamin-related protein 1B (Dnm1B) [Monocercomonoides exilis]|uniref:Dynamin-related protein 1B (Dnm1B) n=1 Tax=Monocercomonoides exilis TaxID=2049356 RepID=UPI003559D2CF|nr:Dynamin-related protein 1B (Dnm1B) [Monocercomonoides exilis]|eukprot:MONOS_8036.1-p1 / transcript=MONOS_8036.1 / gene=MONOS_8036 / organism=Monocercomonoides_exilis_PA203 / gene_product=Dynamin-related protein 1B (DRP1B) / transcript_product=Dynamin-related protein 1B (DRP1B) / location=Mono_scaffold00292:10633-13110(-) / protein_length=826 / sequence_SO=supercontig / SO=protein_coding / is_pseudo=false
MESLLTVMSRLMRVFAQARVPPVQLPQIVVVGSQSSGKSSVIEAIVQRDFLPRGSGIVTRRPLQLTLVNESASGSDEEWGEFAHLKGKKFHDFSEIKQEIQNETNKVAGTAKGVSAEPIVLTIHSPSVVNLILVDLPGLTKVAVEGQPKDIEKQIADMVEKYISQERTIILAVSPGPVDLANSDSLKLAQRWDPKGERTLGVITKLDLMDRGTDASDVLQNRVFRLRLGYVGLCLRSQDDINKNKTVRDALKDEEAFFRSHPAYSSFADQCGTMYLGQTLSKLLLNHVRMYLPQINKQIHAQLSQTQQELLRYGVPPEEQGGFGVLLLTAINEFSTKVNESLEGTVSDEGRTELRGGARLNRVFREVFLNDLDRTKFDLEMSQQELLIQMRNSLGVNSLLFIPEKCFYQLSKKQIERLRDPCVRCVELAHAECNQLLKTTLHHVTGIERFPKLRQRLLEETSQMAYDLMKNTLTTINNIIDVEESYINTRHPEFRTEEVVASVIIEKEEMQKRREMEVEEAAKHPKTQQKSSSKDGAGSNAQSSTEATFKYSISQNSQAMNLQALTESDEVKVEIVRRLVYRYFDITRKAIGDLVPKTIMHFLINALRRTMQTELMKRLYKESLFEELLSEDEDVKRRRSLCVDRMKVLQESTRILDDVSFSSSMFDLTTDSLDALDSRSAPLDNPSSSSTPSSSSSSSSSDNFSQKPTFAMSSASASSSSTQPSSGMGAGAPYSTHNSSQAFTFPPPVMSPANQSLSGFPPPASTSSSSSPPSSMTSTNSLFPSSRSPGTSQTFNPYTPVNQFGGVSSGNLPMMSSPLDKKRKY